MDVLPDSHIGREWRFQDVGGYLYDCTERIESDSMSSFARRDLPPYVNVTTRRKVDWPGIVTSREDVTVAVHGRSACIPAAVRSRKFLHVRTFNGTWNRRHGTPHSSSDCRRSQT